MDQSQPTYQPLLRIALAIACGILLDRLLDVPIGLWCISVAIASTFWAVAFRARWFRSSSFALLTLLLMLGAAWHSFHWNWIGTRDVATFATLDAQPAMIQGRIAGQPRRLAPDKQQEKYSRIRGERTRVLIEISAIRNRGTFRQASGLVELFIDGRLNDLRSGDQIQCAGDLAKISPPSNPGQFDLQNYFRGKRTLCWMDLSSAECLRKIEAGNLVAKSASSLRVSLDSLLWRYLDAQTAPLASAMLLGNRQQLDQLTRDNFMLSGTVHLLAISGLHVGILASLILMLSRIGLLSRRKGLLMTILFVALYAWLVEFRPPVTRAAILISIFCYCRWIGRTPFSFNILALAAIVVLAINPVELFGPGAQLSFLAVGTLIYARHWIAPPRSEDPIDRLIENSRPWHERSIRYLGSRMYMAFAVSAIIWLFAFPAVANQFHIVAPIALIANPLLLIPITTGLVCGLGVLVFGFWMPPVAVIMAAGCQASLQLIQGTVEACQLVNHGHWWTAGPPLVSVICFYSILMLVYLRYDGLRFRTVACGIAVWIVIGWVVPDWQHRSIQKTRTTMHCTVIDVGHGGCVLMQLPHGKNVLYDCGSFGSPRKAHQTAAGVLWHHRISHLDAVVISHADSDHFNGLPALAKQFSIDRVIVSHHFQRSASDKPMIKMMLDELQQADIQIQTVSMDEHLDIGSEVKMEVLNPPIFGFATSDNANSIVLDIEFNGRRILLPGDLEKDGLNQLLRRKPHDYDVVMSPHHGSKNSRPAEFFSWCDPEVIVTSSGRGKNHNLGEYLPEHLEGQILHTGYDGAVQINLTPAAARIRTWADDPW